LDALDAESSATAREAWVAIAKQAIKIRGKNRFIVQLLDWEMMGTAKRGKKRGPNQVTHGEKFGSISEIFMTD
jgi:hypothetical protein